MMMERAKPAAEEETAAVTSKPAASSVTNNSSAEERVNDLERRLNNLGGENTKSASTVPSQAASGQGKNNPLLARIIAAQDRARQAEQKEKEAKAAAQAQAEQSKREADAERLKREEEERIEKAQSALRLAAGHALESKQDEILRELEGKPAVVDQPLQTVQPAVPIMKSLDPSPPFESMKYPPPQVIPGDDRMRGHGMNSRAISSTQQPPSFDLVMQKNQKEPPAPSAPNLSPTAPPSHHYLEGILPVAPPFEQAQKPPPSFDTFEQQQHQQQQEQQQQPDNLKTPEEDIIDFDVDGNPLTPEQREAMIEEQRQLYANIMKEKAENDAAIAKATADAFDSRSSNAAAKAMDRHESHTQAMDSMGRNISGEEDDCKEEEPTSRNSRRMVKVGKNQMVALHGQGRTKKAIKDGTAILVQCINCQNWMQVTGTATLMFCPVCQVVSPVIKQTEVLTKEEAIQLTMDRKLAEKLQAEAYEHEEKESQEDEGYFSKLFGARENSAGDAVRSSSVASTDSWWSKISNIVSYGVAEEPRERGDLGVTLPPGGSSSISTYPGERRNTLSPVTSRDDRENSHQEETHSLLRPVIDGNEANLPAARVAEQKPLFSCVTDSVSSAASALFSTGVGEEDEEGLIYGVDSSSLLVTSAGRDAGDGAGEYSRVSDNE